MHIEQIMYSHFFMQPTLGVYFLITNCAKKQQNADEYLIGGNHMNPILVGFSMVASVINAIFLLGLASVIVHIIVPMFCNFSNISGYQVNLSQQF